MKSNQPQCPRTDSKIPIVDLCAFGQQVGGFWQSRVGNTKRVVSIGAILFAVCLLHSPSAAGELVSHVIQSRSLTNASVDLTTNREIKVLLPDSYATSDRSYPVVYWFPGGGQIAAANIRVPEIEAEFTSGRSDEAIVVFMDSKTEFGTSLYLSSDVFGDWQGHVQDEVIPLVDELYRTNSTADQRGVMGFSLGGLTSVFAPIFMPDTFGAVGANDPSVSFTAGSVRDRSELPEGYQPSTSPTPLSEFFENFPDDVNGYGDVPIGNSGYGQLAVTLTPNPDSPILGDIPFGIDEDGNGFWNPEVREIWRQFDLLNPDSIALYEDAYRELATVSVALPDTAVNTSRAWNAAMLKEFDNAGIETSGIQSVGDHNDFQHERFAALLGDVTYALRGENVASINGDGYVENFDGLSESVADSPAALPSGWSVGVGETSVFRDRTNTLFNDGDIVSAGAGPHILDLGTNEDRSLGVHLQNTTNSAAIQFLTNIDGVDANALSLTFDVEVWDRLAIEEGLDPAAPSQVGFRVSAQFDFGDGFESSVDLGEVSLSDLVDPTAALLDGNLDSNRAEFTLRGGGPFAAAQQLRLIFEADETTTSPGWVFGLDDVSLEFEFLGDFDGDSELTIDDVNLLGAAIRHSGLERFDLTGDGLVDTADLDFWVLDLFGTSLGDANLDNAVDFSDFLRFSQNFGTDEPVVWQDGDFDADGVVGFSDFLAFSRAFGVNAIGQQSVAQAASVPEPSTLVLAFLSLAFVGLRGRRQL